MTNRDREEPELAYRNDPATLEARTAWKNANPDKVKAWAAKQREARSGEPSWRDTQEAARSGMSAQEYETDKRRTLERYAAAQTIKHKEWAESHEEEVLAWKSARDANRSPERRAAEVAEWRASQPGLDTSAWHEQQQAEQVAAKVVGPVITSPAQRSLDAALWASRQEDGAVSTVEPVSERQTTSYVDGAGVSHQL